MTQPRGQVLVKRACRQRLRLEQLALVVGDLVGVRGHLVQPAHGV